MITFKILIFIILTILFAIILRRSFVNIHSHGFTRFFAFECILVLFLLNVEHWFVSPFSFNQIISWTCLFISAYLVIEGYRLLHSKGKIDVTRTSKDLYKIEKTTKLVTEGVYGFIRHPLYSSLLFLAWGIFFKFFSTLGFILTIVTSFFIVFTAKKEEIENYEYFGDEYHSFKQKTKMFIPYIW
jgi:protein-S-isoprenylcysteine O-methyltransferase Ste14